MENNLTDRLTHTLSVLKNHVWYLVIPAAVCAFVAGLYGITKTDTYTARQSLVIRDDLIGQAYKPGRFESLDSLKSAQETVLEIARRPEVIRNALKRVGPVKSFFSFLGGSQEDYPDEQTIEAIQGMISIGAPNGAEFGKTELFVLSAQANSRERANKFIEVLLEELEAKIREVRTARLLSMEAEVKQQILIAEKSFQVSSAKLEKLEAELGTDVVDLRNMSNEIPTEGSLQRSIQLIETEKRVALDQLESAKQQLELLTQAIENPDMIPSTSSELFALQPTLEPLFRGLSEAQLALATNSGRYQESHPIYLNSQQTVQDIGSRIKTEIITTIDGLNSQIALLEAHYQRRNSAQNELVQRLDSLGKQRVGYDRLNYEVKSKREALGQAYGSLNEVQSLGSASEQVDMLTRVGSPQVPTSPDGLGTKMLVVMAGFGGLMIGFGIVVLIAPPFPGEQSCGSENARVESNREASPSAGRTFAGANRSNLTPETGDREVPPSVEPAETRPSFASSAVKPSNPTVPTAKPLPAMPARVAEAAIADTTASSTRDIDKPGLSATRATRATRATGQSHVPAESVAKDQLPPQSVPSLSEIATPIVPANPKSSWEKSFGPAPVSPPEPPSSAHDILNQLKASFAKADKQLAREQDSAFEAEFPSPGLESSLSEKIQKPVVEDHLSPQAKSPANEQFAPVRRPATETKVADQPLVAKDRANQPTVVPPGNPPSHPSDVVSPQGSGPDQSVEASESSVETGKTEGILHPVRRRRSVRPVDLIKNETTVADDENADESTPQAATKRARSVTQEAEDLVRQLRSKHDFPSNELASADPPSGQKNPGSSRQPAGQVNPFLAKRESQLTPAKKTPLESPPSSETPQPESVAKPETRLPDITVPIPEQIRAIGDSLTAFCAPEKDSGKNRPTG